MRKYCPKCSLYIPLYPEDGKCPGCGQSVDLPTMGELEQVRTWIPIPETGSSINWSAIFGSFRDMLYLASVVIALERRRAEERERDLQVGSSKLEGRET